MGSLFRLTLATTCVFRYYTFAEAPSPPPAKQAAVRAHEPPLDIYVRSAARTYGVPERLIRAVIHVESAGRTDAVSEKGALGLMQLMPATAASLGVDEPLDPGENVFGGARYLRYLIDRFHGDVVLALAAYNAGEGAVARYRGIPPYRETREYLRRVARELARSREEAPT